jgi:hypothetical protein
MDRILVGFKQREEEIGRAAYAKNRNGWLPIGPIEAVRSLPCGQSATVETG